MLLSINEEDQSRIQSRRRMTLITFEKRFLEWILLEELLNAKQVSTKTNEKVLRTHCDG